MKNYLLKCLYNVRTRGGKVKTKSENVNLTLDATPEQIHASPRLHKSLGKAFQKQNMNKVIAVEIKEVIELLEDDKG
jgi:hypothetical protein